MKLIKYIMGASLLISTLLTAQTKQSSYNSQDNTPVNPVIKVLDSIISDLSTPSQTNSSESKRIDSKLLNREADVKKPIEGWGKLKLGLTVKDVKAVLSNQYPWMVLRKPAESTDTISDKIFFLETYKNDFFSKIQFQFDLDQRLYLLRVEMNPRYFSFVSLYNRLFQSYGPAQENTYTRVVWRDGSRDLELYRNNTVVYLERSGLDSLPGSSIEDQREKLLNTVFDNL